MRTPWIRQLIVLGAAALLLLNLARPAFAPPLQLYSVNSTTSVTITTTTETVLCTLPGVTGAFGTTIRLMGWAQVTAGTGTTALTLRLERGTAAGGTLVGPANPVQITAANTVQLAHMAQDTPGEVANQSYVLTGQQTAATANGTGLSCEIIAWVY